MLKLSDKARQALKHRKGFQVGLYNVPTEEQSLRLMAGISVFIEINGKVNEMTIGPQTFLELILEEAKEEFL